MCNEYQLVLPFDDVIEEFNRTGSRLVFPGGMPNGGRSLDCPLYSFHELGEWADKVAGFRAGADDYAVKPFRLDEVVIRAQTLVRRAAGHAQPTIRAGALLLDTQLGVITRDGLPLKLTAFEQRILAYLIHHKRRVVSRTELADHLYDANADRDFKSIEVVIGRLR